MKNSKVVKTKKTPKQTDFSRDLLTSAVSASLRIIIPIFTLFFVGLAIDALHQTVATFSIFGAIAGFIISIFLIWSQVTHRDNAFMKAIFLTEEYDEDKKLRKKSKK